MGHVLEHVDNPVEILSLAKSWLTDDGLIIAAVPNSQSLHRQAATKMGLLSIESELNEEDIHHGHKRVFDPMSFTAIFNQASLNILKFGGYFLKPLSDSQISQNWSVDLLKAYLFLGESYPRIAGEIYIVGAKN